MKIPLALGTTSVLGAAVVLLQTACGFCGNSPVQLVQSPDKQHAVAVYVRDCGATTGFSTHVSVLTGRAPALPDGAGNALIVDAGRHYNMPPARRDIPLSVEWTSSDHVVIQYPAGARVFKAAKRASGVTITYRKCSGPLSDSCIDADPELPNDGDSAPATAPK